MSIILRDQTRAQAAAESWLDDVWHEIDTLNCPTCNTPLDKDELVVTSAGVEVECTSCKVVYELDFD